MADTKKITVKQLRAAMKKADKRLDDLELGKADKISLVSISIPVSAWVEDTDTTIVAAGFAYHADAAVEDLTAANSTETVLDLASLEPAKACGMANTAIAMAGVIRYYAVNKPTTTLNATVLVFEAKSCEEVCT